jgi:hypothetical protein
MLRRLGRHIRQNVVAWLALFLALGGTGAYAANTISTGDIVDNQVTSADVRDDNLAFGGLSANDLGPGSVLTSELRDNSVLGADIQDGTVSHADAALNTFRGSDIADDSLTGLDINESTLLMPPTTTATFAGQGSVAVGDAYTKITSKTLPAGSYAIVATANILGPGFFAGTHYNDTACELRNPSGQFIGGARDRREFVSQQNFTLSLSMNGGATLSSSGEVGLYCRFQAGGATGDGQMVIIRLDGTF